jgi:hypothetical protein
MWILKDNPDLSDPKVDSNRVQRSWAPSQVRSFLRRIQLSLLFTNRKNSFTMKIHFTLTFVDQIFNLNLHS